MAEASRARQETPHAQAGDGPMLTALAILGVCTLAAAASWLVWCIMVGVLDRDDDATDYPPDWN